MISRKILPYITVFTLCLLTSIAGGEDWLEGGFVRSYSGDIAQYFTDPIFYPTGGQPYQFKSGIYPGPYGVYPFYPSPYYSDFRLNSLAGMNWEPFQKNWAKTVEYAQTKSSFRVYPRPTTTYPVVQVPAPTYVSTQPPAATIGDSTATIISQRMRGYQVFLDGTYVGTEGTGGDPLDGKFSFRVVGNQNHEIRVYDGQFNYPKTMFFERGGTKVIHVEPGTAVYT